MRKYITKDRSLLEAYTKSKVSNFKQFRSCVILSEKDKQAKRSNSKSLFAKELRGGCYD